MAAQQTPRRPVEEDDIDLKAHAKEGKVEV